MATKNNKEINELTTEEAFARLEDLISKMEEDDLSLEDSFSTYEEGLKLVKLCSDKLDMIEKKIIVLEKDAKES